MIPRCIFISLALIVAALAQDTPRCSAPAEATELEHAPIHFRERIARGLPIKIVAIGSSSTFGTGATSPDKSYPGQLAAELKARLPGLPVTVLNKGVGGEEAPQMVARFEADVIEENPDLVLWQVGSNSVLRDRPLSEAPAALNAGLKLLREHGADVVLMNPQYTPKVFTKHDVEGMVNLIAIAAKEKSVDLFQRYAVMRYWQLTEGIPFGAFTSSDELHMNDWSYGCLAKLVAGAIHDAATRSTLTATVNHRR